jgi:hypothetical protein
MLLLILSGCAYKVALTSAPAGARVALPDGTEVFTPEVVTFRAAPFRAQPVTVSAPGFRPLTIDLRRSEVQVWRIGTDAVFRPNTLFGAPRREVQFTLVPQHGPTGTWSPETEGLVEP